MGKKTGIQWASSTWSPWWGCSEVPGANSACSHCYARDMAKRFGHRVWGDKAPRLMMSETHWKAPLRWDAEAAASGEQVRVFPSMCDPFEDRPDLDEPRERFWSLIDRTPNLTWMLLTKRTQNIGRMLNGRGWNRVWLGATVEAQEHMHRWHELADAAEIRNCGATFLSVEPMLGPVSIECHACGRGVDAHSGNGCSGWWPSMVIVGCESGSKARPMDEDWVRRLGNECIRANVSLFYKQAMAGGKLVELPQLDGERWTQFPKVPR